MKNSSWKHPFPTFADKMFDGNKDGKLDAFETAFRDAHLEEMNRNAEQKKPTVKNSIYREAGSAGSKDHADTIPVWARIIYYLTAAVTLFCGAVLAIIIEGSILAKAILLLAFVIAVIGLLSYEGIIRKRRKEQPHDSADEPSTKR